MNMSLWHSPSRGNGLPRQGGAVPPGKIKRPGHEAGERKPMKHNSKKPKGGRRMSTVYASPIWLGRPHCPVTVTTGAGAVVTAALGSLTLTATADANGLCAMKLPIFSAAFCCICRVTWV